MTYPPEIGKTPQDWAEEEARRHERRERVHNPHGREVGRGTRVALALVISTLLVLMVMTTVLGLLGVIPIFTPSRPA